MENIMPQQPQMLVPTLTQANTPASVKLISDGKKVAPRTYISSAKNSTFIMPSGVILQFKQVNRVGHLTTDDPYEQCELDAAIKSGAHISVLGSVADAVQRIEASPQQAAAESLQAAQGFPEIPQTAVNLDAIAAARDKLMQLNVQVGGTNTGAVNSASTIAKAAAPSIAK